MLIQSAVCDAYVTCVLHPTVHSYACPLWRVSLHGCGFTQWSSGEFHLELTCSFAQFLNNSVYFNHPELLLIPICCLKKLPTLCFFSLWTVWSCSWCQPNTSLTWSTCGTSPRDVSTSSPLSRACVWLSCGSSSLPWLPSSSPLWWATSAPSETDRKGGSSGCESWTKTFLFRFLLQILALVAVRKAMDYLFSQHDLSYLDDVIPEKDKKKKEDEKKKKQKKKGSIDSEIDFVSAVTLSSWTVFL